MPQILSLLLKYVKIEDKGKKEKKKKEGIGAMHREETNWVKINEL